MFALPVGWGHRKCCTTRTTVRESTCHLLMWWVSCKEICLFDHSCQWVPVFAHIFCIFFSCLIIGLGDLSFATVCQGTCSAVPRHSARTTDYLDWSESMRFKCICSGCPNPISSIKIRCFERGNGDQQSPWLFTVCQWVQLFAGNLALATLQLKCQLWGNILN